MAAAKVDPTSFGVLFRQAAYSDIMIKLSDGEIPCHKAVICNRSEYFKKLCGQGSHFAESNQKVIELKEDKPDALEAVIRYLYFGACVAPEAEKKKPWSFYAEVSRTADKYLLRDLAHDAMNKSILKIRDIFGVTQLCDVVLDIRRNFIDEEALTDEMWQLQEEYFDEFLLEPKFVAAMSEKEVREQFNRLRLTYCGTRERTGHICGRCERIYNRPGCKVTSCEGSTKPTTYWLPRLEQNK